MAGLLREAEAKANPLIAAAGKGDLEAVKALLAAGTVDLEARHSNTCITALMQAGEHGHAEVAGLLLAAGADVGAKGKNGDTALSLAAAHGHAEVARVLRDLMLN